MNYSTCLWDRLRETDRPILIYGMGDGCDKIYAVCQKKNIPIQGIFASDGYVRNKTVHGFPVIGYSEAKKRYPDMIALLAFGVFRDDLMEQIRQIHNEIELYAPEVPLFGGSLFDADYADSHKKEIEAVREMLDDEQSVSVFDCLLEYKLTGRIDPLLRCQSEKEDDMKTLVPYRAGDVYVDLGAYDGDTVLEWAALHPDHGKILAVEPNPKTFEKMRIATEHLPGITPLKKAVWNRDETLFFNGKSGRSAAISNEGTLSVEGARVSSFCSKADFIKFDVEGAEKEAIEGCESLIREQKPTLCISAYHRTEDFFAIPLQIKRICPQYRVSLRHWQYIPAWDTVYYFSCR